MQPAAQHQHGATGGEQQGAPAFGVIAAAAQPLHDDGLTTPHATSNGTQGRRKRVWEEWEGNEVFFLDGRLVAGPNWRACAGTAFLLLAPSGIFLAFVAPYVAKQVHAIILVFSCLLPVLCALFLFLTACRDPGIIPRREPDEEYLAGRKPRTKEVEVNGHRVLIRYNDTCHFYQPPRAHHCSVSDNCMRRFDHACPWVGCTIAERNYRFFLLFIFTATILCLYVMGVCLAQLFLRHQELVDDQRAAGNNVPSSSQWGQAFRDVIPALVLAVYTFLFVWFVGGLSAFHIFLSATNQTTYENFRYNHDSRPNPYDRGILSNCFEIWCTPIPPSEVQFRAFIDEWPYPRPPQPDLVAAAGSGHIPANVAPAAAAAALTAEPVAMVVGADPPGTDVELGRVQPQPPSPHPQHVVVTGVPMVDLQQQSLHRRTSASLNPLYQQDHVPSTGGGREWGMPEGSKLTFEEAMTGSGHGSASQQLKLHSHDGGAVTSGGGSHASDLVLGQPPLLDHQSSLTAHEHPVVGRAL